MEGHLDGAALPRSPAGDAHADAWWSSRPCRGYTHHALFTRTAMRHCVSALALVAVLLTAAPLAAQPWARAYTTGGGSSVAAMPDGGVVAVGYGTDEVTFGRTALVVRTDVAGDTLWTRRLSRSNFDELGFDVVPLPEGDVLVVGTAYVQSAFVFRPWVVRLAADGSTVYTTDDGLTATLPVRSGIVRGTLRADGRLVLVGGNNTVTSLQAPWVAVVDPADGALVSFRLFSPSPTVFGYGTYVATVAPTPDGGVVFAGTAGWGVGEAYVWKLDASADSAWVRTYRAEGLRVFHSARVAPDGDLLLAGCELPNCDEARVLRTDADGAPRWIYAGATDDIVEARDAVPLSDGRTLVLRRLTDAVASPDFDSDVVVLDAAGAPLSTRVLPGGATGSDGTATLAMERLDLVGSADWFTAVGRCATEAPVTRTSLCLVRDEPEARSVGTEAPPAVAALRVAPNPALGALRVAGAAALGRAEVVDALGRRHAARLAGDVLDVRGLAPGPYTLRVEADGRWASVRFVVAR